MSESDRDAKRRLRDAFRSVDSTTDVAVDTEHVKSSIKGMPENTTTEYRIAVRDDAGDVVAESARTDLDVALVLGVSDEGLHIEGLCSQAALHDLALGFFRYLSAMGILKGVLLQHTLEEITDRLKEAAEENKDGEGSDASPFPLKLGGFDPNDPFN